MGKRNVEKITVDGTDYTLMQFSDFSYIPNRYDATRYQMELANGIYYPTGVSVQGNTMNDIIPQGIGSSADNVSKPIDNYNAILLKQVPASQGNANFFSFYNSSNELLFEEGYLMTNYEANTLVNFAIVIDDDGFADVIGVLHYYNGSVTATRIDHFGGNGEIGQKIYAVFAQEASQSYTSNGGGATHIAKVTGQLKDLSSNLSDILLVSGGGGGGLLSGEDDYSGKEAGGISGSGDNSADQTTGNAFGLGESGTNVSGGGSGLYGGYKGTSSKSGGAGSGYIGNSLLSNKKMVGYNVPTSSAEGTKTESVNEASADPVSGKPKSGNGFARIKFLRYLTNVTLEDMVRNANFLTDYKYIDSGTNWSHDIFQVNNMNQYRNNDYTLYANGSYWGEPLILDHANDVYSIPIPEYNTHSEQWALFVDAGIPINRRRIVGIDLDFRFDDVILPLTKWSGSHIPFMRVLFYQPNQTDGCIWTRFDITDKTTSVSKTTNNISFAPMEMSWAGSDTFVISDNNWHSLSLRFANNASYEVDFISIHQEYIPMHYKNIKFILAKD